MSGAHEDLYFIYLGNKFPSYGLASLKLASENSGMKVHLIGNRNLNSHRISSLATFHAVEDFYDSSQFSAAASLITSNSKFRNGLWIRSLERFFVLDQFMKFENLESAFHAELDQILFRTDRLVHNLSKSEKIGLFLPFHSENAAVASVLFCNDREALRSLLDFGTHSDPYPNEMVLISKWAKANPKRIHPLATLASVCNPAAEIPSYAAGLSAAYMGGIVDAAQVGQWVAGIDPKNVPILKRPSNKFVDEPTDYLLTKSQLSSTTLAFDTLKRQMFISCQSVPPSPIYNLHIHSKVHSFIERDMSKFVDIANSPLPTSFPGTRRTQAIEFFSHRIGILRSNPGRVVAELRRQINVLFKRRPGSQPFISGDSFRAMARHIWENDNKQITPAGVMQGDLIFCQSELIHELHDSVLSKIESKVVLILSNSDQNHLRNEVADLATVNTSVVFAQNLLESVQSFEALPIGLENAYRANHGRTLPFRWLRLFPQKKSFRIMWTFAVGNNVPERGEAASSLSRNLLADHLGSLTARKHRNALSRYAFVASPPGNGLDCHRTWEAMYLGSVPIVRRSFMTEEYFRIGLPVWIVDSYDELLGLSESDLVKKYDEFQSKFNSEALWMHYWEQRIEFASKTAVPQQP